jgi:hypothetical protein
LSCSTPSYAEPSSRSATPGVVCSFDTDSFEPLETVETGLGAHTCGWDPDGQALYVFCPSTSRALLFEESG